MTTIKAGRPLIELVRLCYAADTPVLLVGPHGVGKSQILEQAAKELKIQYICRDLSLMEPPDLVGLPKLDGKVTRYLRPSFLPTDGKGLLVFEELNRCQPYMRAPCLQLLTSRTLNDYVLRPGWLPVAAINPPDKGYEVDELDEALLSRFVRVGVVPDRDEWLVWARQSGVHPDVIGYVESDLTVFDHPKSNPRAWAFVSTVLHAAAGIENSRESLRVAIAGLVGNKRAAAFLQVLGNDERPLTAEQVFAYHQHRKQVQGWVAGGRLDLLRSTLLDLQKQLQSRPKYEVAKNNPEAWKNIGDFLRDLPGDLRQEAEAFFVERELEIPRTSRRRRA